MQGRASIVGVLLLAILAAVPAAAQPTVIATNPADGATGVVGPVLTIGVKFSEPMNGKHSLVTADGGEFPEPVGDPWFEDDTTFCFQAKVQPGKDYAVGLNSPARTGFASAAGQALSPAVLRFRTAEQFPAAAPQAADGAPIVVATSPAAGATGVVGPEITVHVRFSEPVKMNSWSLVAAEGGKEPQYQGDPWFTDNLTFHVKAQVEPDTAYALGLNSQSRHGFVSADGGRPVAPFVLRFTTAPPGAAAPAVFHWAATAPATADASASDRPAEDEAEAAPQGPGPGIHRVRFGIEWLSGETQERVTAAARHFDYTSTDGGQGVYDQTVTTSVALQAIATDRGNPVTINGKATNFEVTQPDPQTGQAQTLKPPLPPFVMQATNQAGAWTAQGLGGAVDPGLLQAFADDVAVGSPFATAGLVPVNSEWELSGKQLQAALGLLSSEDLPDGRVTCTFREITETDGQRVAVIDHTWKVRFGFQGLNVDAEGQGTSQYLIDARRFTSHAVELKCNIPQQQGPSGATFTATGTLKVTQNLRYFPAGQFPELVASRNEQPALGYTRTQDAEAVAMSITGASVKQFGEGMASLADVFGQPTLGQGGPTGAGDDDNEGGFAAGGFPTGGGAAPAGGGFPTGGGMAPAGGGMPPMGGGIASPWAPPPLAPGIPPELPGAWFMQSADVSILLILMPSGQYSLMVNAGMYLQQESGMYSVEGDMLVLTESLGAKKTPCRFRLVQQNLMQVTTPDGLTVMLMRQG